MVVVSPYRKRSVLLTILLCAGLGYIALAWGLGAERTASEQRFGEARRDDQRQLRVYVEMLAIDAVNDNLRLRVSVSPNQLLQGRHAAVPKEDIRVAFRDGDNVQELTFRAEDAMPAAAIDADLGGGTIATYPYDRYRVALRVAARDASGAPIPLEVTVWEAMNGWTMSATPTVGDPSGEVRLGLGLKRSGALRLLVSALYGEMTLIALAALTIGGVTFLGLRPPESTLTGALTGMVFALPALRYALPGAPPLGVRADLLVFLWAELAVALSLALFVFAWAQARPGR